MRIITICLCFLPLWLTGCVTHTTITSALNQPLKQDPKLYKGMLNNGLRYLVRENHKPKKQLEFRLILHVGSLQEKAHQLGLAHFLEHMAFNGTQHFNQQAIADFFEQQGLEMGYDVNASTSMGETTYRLNLLNNDEQSIDQALLLLRDWAGNIQLDTHAFNNEKKVVLEEVRMNRGVYERIRSQQRPFSLGEAYRYSPSGRDDVIKSFTPEVMQQFYRDWYRPELMAVVVVGDVQPKHIIKKIKAMFSDLHNPADAPPHHLPKIDTHDGMQQQRFLDPEMAQAIIKLEKKIIEPFKETTISDARQLLMHSLYHRMLNQRFQDVNITERPYQWANIHRFSLNMQLTMQSLTIQVKDQQYLSSLNRVLTELERLHRHGFILSEFKRSKQEFLHNIAQQYAQRNERSSARYAAIYSDHIFEPETHMSDQNEYRLFKTLLSQLRLKDINAMPTPFHADKNQTLSFIGHTSFAKNIPSKSTVHAMLAATKMQKNMAAYQDEFDHAPLIAHLAKKGRIVSEKRYKKTGITVLKLSNGVNVLLKPTKIQKIEILFHTYSNGGLAQAGSNYRATALMMQEVLEESGLGLFSAVQLNKKLATKTAWIYPYLSLHEEGLRGKTNEHDIETLMQLIHLHFTQINVDDAIFADVKKTYREQLQLAQQTASWKFSHAINQQIEPQNDFNRDLRLDDLDKANPKDLRTLMQHRFGNAADFTFQFVGTFHISKMKPLLERYLANLPANAQRESYTWINTNPFDGQHHITINENLAYKSTVMIQVQGHQHYSRYKKKRFSLLKRILTKQLNQRLRKELGLIYGVKIAYTLAKRGEPYSGFRFYFQCAPEHVPQVIQAWKNVVAQLQAKPLKTKPLFVTQATLHSIEKSRKARKNKKKSNAYWARKMYHMHLLDLPYTHFPKAKKRLHYTPKAVAYYARKYLTLANITIAVLNPKADVRPKPAPTPLATSLH